MTKGHRVVSILSRFVGTEEVPLGSNRGPRGGFIDSAHRMYGLPPSPWCAMGVGYAYRLAGVDDSGVIHPYTGEICLRAKNKSLILRSGRVPTGALLVRCGVHVEVAVRDRGNGLIDAIGCNVDHGIRRTVRRRDDWVIVVPPDILRPSDHDQRRHFFFEDTSLRPIRFGPWRVRAWRDRRMAAAVARHPRHRVRKWRQAGGYGFDLVRGDGIFGPWDSRRARDLAMAARQRRTGRRMRPFSVAVDDLGDLPSGPTTETSTT